MESIRLTVAIFILCIIALILFIFYNNISMEHFTTEDDKKKSLLEALAKAKAAREATQQKMRARFEAAKAKKAEEDKAAIELAALNAAAAERATTNGSSASGTTGSGTTGSGTTGTGTTGSGTTGSGTTGSGTTGSGTTGSGTTGSGTSGSGTTGSGTNGSGTNGSGTNGSRTTSGRRAGSRTSDTPPPPIIAVPGITTVPNPTTGNFTILPNKGFNISQIGGEGPNNYFHPNIIIKKKKEDPFEAARNNVGLAGAMQSLYPNMSQETIQAAVQQYVFNTGYNFSTGGTTSSYNDPWNTALSNSAMDASMPNVNSCIDCKKDPETGDVNYGGNYGTSYESFNPTDDENNEKNNEENNEERDDRQRNYRPPKYEEEPSPRAGLDANGNFIPSCKMKTFVPGFQIQPPKCWDVPQKRPPVCLSDKKRLPAAVFDRGTPLNALEMDTTVGSILPKFIYTELARDRS